MYYKYYKFNFSGWYLWSLLIFFNINYGAVAEVKRAVDVDVVMHASELDAACLNIIKIRYGLNLEREWRTILRALKLEELDLDLTDADNLELLNHDVLLGYRDTFGVIDRAWSLATKTYRSAEALKAHVGKTVIGDFSAETAELLRDTLKKSGVDPARIVLCDQNLMQKKATEQTPFAVYTDRATPDKHYLLVNREICSDENMSLAAGQILYHGAYGIEAHKLLEHLLRHEASHIFYNEILLQSLLQRQLVKKIQRALQFSELSWDQAETGLQHFKKALTAVNSFYEKRADTLACLSGPDPLGYAQYMLDNVAEGLYAYRSSADWRSLIADLKHC